MNIIWCCVLHSLYDMASGFGDFSVINEVSQKASQPVESIIPYLMNTVSFLPLLIYGLFLMRNMKEKDK